MNKRSGIYRITNGLTGGIYIGSAINLYNRWATHCSLLKNNRHENNHLQKAWNKYGSQVFSFSILEYIENKTDLIIREQFWMDTLCPHYNICPKAGSRLGTKTSLATRLQQSIDRKGKSYHSVEGKARIAERMKGNKYAAGRPHHLSLETRAKISATLKGTRHSSESYARQAEKVRGRKLSQEHRARLCVVQTLRRKRESQIKKGAINEKVVDITKS